MVQRFSCKSHKDWVAPSLQAVRHSGCCVIEDVLSRGFLDETAEALYRVREMILSEIGQDRIDRAGEIGVLRLMQLYDPHFFKFLEIPEALTLIDRTVSPTAIQHMQNGFIWPSRSEGTAQEVFQNQFHRDFPRVLNGYMMSVNLYFTITDFTVETGATRVVPGTHQTTESPDPDYLANNAITVECPPGSILFFDSTLWHAAGENISGKDRLSINHQFTRSYVKQQIDYPRALGERGLAHPVARTQRLLGYWTRVPTSLDEYYRPPETRLYRSGQG